MRTKEFPYGACRYATNKELEVFNKIIKQHNQEGRKEEILEHLPRFYIGEVDIQPNPYDLEPPIGRREDGKLLWDCARRTEAYNSIDVRTTLKSRGTLYEI